jgi:hypothetical protein
VTRRVEAEEREILSNFSRYREADQGEEEA